MPKTIKPTMNKFMMCKDCLGRIWKAPIFGNPSKEELYKQELSFKKYIFNKLNQL